MFSVRHVTLENLIIIKGGLYYTKLNSPVPWIRYLIFFVYIRITIYQQLNKIFIAVYTCLMKGCSSILQKIT